MSKMPIGCVKKRAVPEKLGESRVLKTNKKT
jgi:hypothetical protein